MPWRPVLTPPPPPSTVVQMVHNDARFVFRMQIVASTGRPRRGTAVTSRQARETKADRPMNCP